MSRPPPLARAEHRPDPHDWADDDPMTLAEYIAVFYPRGPLMIASLRAEIAKGRLTPAVVAGKHFVTPAQVRALFQPEPRRCRAMPKVRAFTSGADGSTIAQGARSRTSTSSETERYRSARAALQIACMKLKEGSRSTSPGSGNRRSQPTAEVIHLKS